MKTHAIAVPLLLLGASGLLFGIGAARAAEPNLKPGATPQATSEEAKAALEEAQEQAILLRVHLKEHQKNLEAMEKPTLEVAEKKITFLQNEIKRVQEEKLAKRPEWEAAKNKVLDGYRRELDHYKIARSKLDENAVDLAPDSDLTTTKFAKYEMARIKRIEAELAKKEQEVSALQGSVPTTSSETSVAADSKGATATDSKLSNDFLQQKLFDLGPGIVPNLKGMTRLEALAAVKHAKLEGSVSRYEGERPKNDEERNLLIVTSQSPGAGAKLEPGKGVVSVTLTPPVDILVLENDKPKSDGLDDSSATSPLDGFVPDLHGMSGAQAIAALRERQLYGRAQFFGHRPKTKEERDQMTVSMQDAEAGTHLGRGSVVVVTLDAKAPKNDKPEEATAAGKPALPEELRGNWTGQIVVTQGSEKLPAECKTVNVEGGKMAEGITMNLGELNDAGKGQLTFGAQHQGEQKKQAMPFSYDATNGKLHIEQQQDGGTIVFDGQCHKTAAGLVIDGEWTVNANGVSLGGKWKQTKQQ